jgi:hypothetical protein
MPIPLAATRFTKIEGTAVAVTVKSAEEAKAALKELRHKKRELRFLRSALVRQQRAARPQKGKGKRSMSGFQIFSDDLRWAFWTLIMRRGAGKQASRRLSPAEIEAELRKTNEILHNIDGCILQVEGKLLTQSQ